MSISLYVLRPVICLDVNSTLLREVRHISYNVINRSLNHNFTMVFAGVKCAPSPGRLYFHGGKFRARLIFFKSQLGVY